ncbi:MAG TPA: DNA-processing protein DprA [Ilumatobacter sp.]|nr:DNA-processing protein DprA [Ilumatobacter sp.]
MSGADAAERRDLAAHVGPLPEHALVALTDLAGLPSAGPWRLRRLMWHHPPDEAWCLLRDGGDLHPAVHRALDVSTLRALRREAGLARPGAVLERCARLGVDTVPVSDPRYPEPLRHDAQAPVVLFARGDLAALDARRVAIVGTRNATAAGRATAAELGEELARAGVTVVSGLARGIDGAAHRGARAAGGPGRAVGVVANGLDHPYPRQHTDLWRWVGEAGVLLSEWAPGVTPEPWRFPLRNRILAAIAELLVVVESRDRGGSMITVEAATKRDVPVLAVPGSVRSRASDGTNWLIDQGAQPVRSVDDVLVALGLRNVGQQRLPFGRRPAPDTFQQLVLDLCAARPCTLDMLAVGLGCGPADAALAAFRLARSGWLEEVGGWFEPAGSRLLSA